MPDNAFTSLSCLWCKNKLKRVDALRCELKDIQPVTRDGFVFAACTGCLELALWMERNVFPGIVVHPGDCSSNPPWITSLRIRCMYCGAKLTADEKDRHRYFEEPYVSFRGRVRGRCYDCCRDGTRPQYKQGASE
ncbi:E6 [Capreolus capreolus papillomavirus 1]|uniref:Protein E6 n=1 Tax=Capreolus capreolus papillomavirus 1 TaxID=470214 RepID=B3ST90_9PAPI|nr:E6 [Capreolus capreolus papillomavirus 1]ABV27560.1 E6 [Capreolus capreolus papillomavirus 1]QNR09261.1 E6 [Capreolus capreolus papillomavirus 1]QNR09269.1 E6 [Capreolus capreolus papillomavirus 1]QNR09277.1 E6 [Capreolus capreolus papillomavirus 1]QNR09285.1 E6 [Capreolus capreolus papillomavirus 1]